MATSDENYPLFPCSSDLAAAARKLDNTPPTSPIGIADFADVRLFAPTLEFDAVIDKNFAKELSIFRAITFSNFIALFEGNREKGASPPPLPHRVYLTFEYVEIIYRVLIKFPFKRVDYRVSRIELVNLAINVFRLELAFPFQSSSNFHVS